MREKAIRSWPPRSWSVAEEDIELVDGTAQVRGVSGAIDRAWASWRAVPTRCAAPSSRAPSRGWKPPRYFGPPRRRHGERRATPCILEVDPETLQSRSTSTWWSTTAAGDQSADPRRPGARRRGAGDRQRLLRAAGLRRERPAAERLFMDYLLPTAARRAAGRGGPRGDAIAAQPDRHQRGGGGRGDPGRARSSPRRWRTRWRSPAWRSWRSRSNPAGSGSWQPRQWRRGRDEDPG